MKIAPKVFMITFIGLEALILLLGYSYYKHSSTALTNEQMEYANQMVHQSDEYLRLNLQHVSSFMTSIVHDTRFQTRDYGEIRSWLNENLIYFVSNVRNIHLLQDDSILISTSPYGWTLLDNDFLRQALSELNDTRKIQWIGPYYSLVSENTVSAAMTVPLTDGTKQVLLLDLDLTELYESLLPNDASIANGELLLLDAEHNPVYGRKPYLYYDYFQRKMVLKPFDASLFQGNWKQTEATNGKNTEIFLTRSRNNPLNWQLVWIMDKTELLRPLNASVNFSIVLAGTSILLSMGVALLISFFIARPIKLITGSIHEVSVGNLDVAVQLNRRDELGLLANHFNRMTNRIRDLIAELKSTEEKKKASDFKALFAQIKPHFLYNTLNTISMAARQGQTEKTDELISSLVQQLEYSLNASPQPVALKDELKHIANYAKLMMNRYPDKFSLDMDIDPITLEWIVPKFTLQPLVENAIFHGLVPNKGNGTLAIYTVVDDEDWRLIVEDDGIGMSEDARSELFGKINAELSAETEATEHIGLGNVHQRLQLMFGPTYDMQVESREQEGTRIVMKIPKSMNRSDGEERSGIPHENGHDR